MKPAVMSAGKLLLSALVLAAVLLLTGEFRWGSGALIAFTGLWTLHLIREITVLRKATAQGARH